jgi:hypothetical protein
MDMETPRISGHSRSPKRNTLPPKRKKKKKLCQILHLSDIFLKILIVARLFLDAFLPHSEEKNTKSLCVFRHWVLGGRQKITGF